MDSSKNGLDRRRRTPEQRQRWLARFQQGHLTLRDFATRHGVGLSTLSKWLRLERDADHSPRRPACAPRRFDLD